jgi:hypothetical protein
MIFDNKEKSATRRLFALLTKAGCLIHLRRRFVRVILIWRCHKNEIKYTIMASGR